MPIGRNELCPCGSGKKFKRCHGAVIAIKPAANSATQPATRQCGSCTACCDGWVKGVIDGHEMKPGTPCHFRGESCCSIYATRPQDPCKNFMCGWIEAASPFPEQFRPDRIGVIIVRKQWRGRAAYVLTSAGRDPDEAILAWMRAFSVRNALPFFYEQSREWTAFGPPEFQIEMLQRLERNECLW